MSVTEQKPRLDEALLALKVRGPDDEGRFLRTIGDGELIFLHKRLSVIDLTEGGHQPKTSSDGRYTLVFNGEIYNFPELRTQLRHEGRVFQTASDTEVLLQAWQQWGEQCLPRLDGMFAFVVYDQVRQSLTCVRDPFGIKPLYYSADVGWSDASSRCDFVFGSTSNAVQALRRRASHPNWQRAYDYLVHADYDSDTESFVDGVLHLLPGHMLHVDLRNGIVQKQQPWWKPRTEENLQLTFEDAAQLVREQFLRNVRIQMRSDVPLGAALSGGIDSSAVVCAMRHLEPDAPLHTFSYIADPGPLSEELWIDQVNRYVGAHAHKVHATGTEMLADLDEMLAAQGEPFGSTSIYAQYRVFKSAKEAGITVTLDGQGADEMLAGYIGYPGQRIQSLLETAHPIAALRFAMHWGRWPGRSTRQAWMFAASAMLSPELEGKARQWMGRDVKPNWLNTELLKEAGVCMQLPWANCIPALPGRRLSAKLADALTVRGLPGLLRHGDRNAMNFSVESRVPFLSPSMVDLCLSLPEKYLISDQGQTKSVFRAAMRGIVPDSILDRKDKIGFATPERQWLQQMAPTARQWLREAQDIPILNMPNLLNSFDSMLAGHIPFSWQAWRWVNFVRWHRITFS